MEKLKKYMNKIYLGIIALSVIVMIVLAVDFSRDRAAAKDEADHQTPIEKMDPLSWAKPEVKVVVDTKIIEDGLNNMGFLITQEYYFTQVETYRKEMKLFKIVPTDSEIVYSYEGAVYAGVDFEKIQIVKDEDNKTLTVDIPPAVIHDVKIDKDTFKVYSEKDYLWNPMKLTDYNASLAEYENAAKRKALENDILEKADKQAERIVMNFIRSIPEANGFKVNVQ